MARQEAADVVAWREGSWFAVRRDGGELRFRRGGPHEDRAGQRVVGRRRPRPADRRRVPERAGAARGHPRLPGAPATSSARPRSAGSSPTPAGRITRAAAATARCCAEDSLVPVLVAGADWPFGDSREVSITDIAPMVERHFGVRRPGAGRPRGGKLESPQCRTLPADEGRPGEAAAWPEGHARRFHIGLRRPDNWLSCSVTARRRRPATSSTWCLQVRLRLLAVPGWRSRSPSWSRPPATSSGTGCGRSASTMACPTISTPAS